MKLAAHYGIDVRPWPAWTATGHTTPTAGTPVINTSSHGNDDYSSFPAMVVDADGTLHLAYRKGGDHNSALNGDMVYRTKPRRGMDGGDGCDSAGHLPQQDGRHRPRVHPLPNGDLLLIFHTVAAGDIRVNYGPFRWDVGRRGRLLERLPVGHFNNGGPSVTDGGFVFHAVYGRPTGSGLPGAYLYRAAVDTPTTWTQYHDDRRAPPGPRLRGTGPRATRRRARVVLPRRQHEEDLPLVVTGPDALVGPDLRVRRLGQAAACPEPGGRRIITTTDHRPGRRGPSSAKAGRTWSTPAYVDARTGMMVYGAVCWTDPVWTGVYGVETSIEGSISAELYEVTFT